MKKKKDGSKSSGLETPLELTSFQDFARTGDIDLSVRLGHITEDEKTLIEYYREAGPETASVLMRLLAMTR
ncbi:MAG: hypothetical protein DYH13_09815 [Alphaproteobacteria bacterium PRO2]|nr:hypothetical protein [Alphaproteobacteria bacterium PRO2]